MKLAQGFLCSLLFGTMVQSNEINLSWQWQSADGQQKHLQLTADERTFSASRHEMTQLDTALNFPLETLYSYISPRLYNSINQINQHSPETATKFRNLEQAFTLHDSSLESAQFWQAYRQYQEDAFYEMRVQPCVHPANQKLPCVRPNYSQLFYQFKGDLKPLAQQFSAKDLATSVTLLQEWLSGIPTRPSRWTTSLRPCRPCRTTRPTATRRRCSWPVCWRSWRPSTVSASSIRTSASAASRRPGSPSRPTAALRETPW